MFHNNARKFFCSPKLELW